MISMVKKSKMCYDIINVRPEQVYFRYGSNKVKIIQESERQQDYAFFK